MDIKYIDGGVTAANGFTASGVHAGIRKNNKLDLALVVSERVCNAAGIYTKNLVQGAPIAVCKKHLADGRAQALIVNSGKANTCSADGEAVALRMCGVAARITGASKSDVLVASTGVIGQPLPIELVESAGEKLAEGLSKDGHALAATAIMTTDTVPKEVAVEFTLSGKTVRLGGMAKGSGMIHPNMATLLSFVTTDAAISSDMLRLALAGVADETFNMVSVDGDTSTNDTVTVMANGLAGNAEITKKGADFDVFYMALYTVMRDLSKMIARDGEGATKLLECTVAGAKSKSDAAVAAKAVISSSLFKAAMFGADANWGRVLCAIGYSGADTDIKRIDVSFKSLAGEIDVCKNGAGVEFSEERAKLVLSEKEIAVNITMHDGNATATAWGCDLTYDYVKINGDYRS